VSDVFLERLQAGPMRVLTFSRAVGVVDMKKLFGVVASLAAGLFAMVGTAMAEVPASVTTSLTDAKADGVEVAGIVIGIIVAIAAFGYMRKAIK
jgi:hypothetical protein